MYITVHQSYRPTRIATLPFSFGHAVRSVGDDGVTLTRTGGRACLHSAGLTDPQCSRAVVYRRLTDGRRALAVGERLLVITVGDEAEAAADDCSWPRSAVLLPAGRLHDCVTFRTSLVIRPADDSNPSRGRPSGGAVLCQWARRRKHQWTTNRNV